SSTTTRCFAGWPMSTTPPSRGSSRPPASSVGALDRMSRQRRTDTKPELAVRRLLHARGLRYRVDYKLPVSGVRRRCDVAFPGRRVAVFVDGCWWHSCPQHSTLPKSNTEWWREKFAANVARDRDTDRRLVDAGWTVVRAWEHEDPVAVADRVERTVRLDD